MPVKACKLQCLTPVGKKGNSYNNVLQWIPNVFLLPYYLSSAIRLNRLVKFLTHFHLYFFKVNKTTMKVNGSVTLGENMADIGVVQLAYRMYRKAAQKLPKDLSLPGLSQYSQQQQFWLAIAQFWCGRQDEPDLKDEHSPWK